MAYYPRAGVNTSTLFLQSVQVNELRLIVKTPCLLEQLSTFKKASLYSLCLRCLLEQLDDLVVSMLSGYGQSDIATVVDIILLCSRGQEELHDLHTSKRRGSIQGSAAIVVGLFLRCSCWERISKQSARTLSAARIKEVYPSLLALSSSAPALRRSFKHFT